MKRLVLLSGMLLTTAGCSASDVLSAIFGADNSDDATMRSYVRTHRLAPSGPDVSPAVLTQDSHAKLPGLGK
jgi:hypothetical protein